jgi:hypothetical protein
VNDYNYLCLNRTNWDWDPVKHFGPEKKEAWKIVQKIYSVLSPSLLVDKWKERALFDYLPTDQWPVHPTYGHCYGATEAFYYLWGKKHGFFPHWVETFEGHHWFLENRKTGEIIDITGAQFVNGPPAYEKGHPCIFPSYPRKSNRCKEILRRIKAL